jgi:tetratricopeptide (TPR) repeat protein
VALNNLARLYLLEKQEPYSALRLLDRLDQRLESLSRDGQYALFKNRGWAKMELGLYDDADGDLAAALRVNGQGIAAHYLLGRVLEALKRPSDAQREFDAVIRIVKGEPESASEVEPDWLVYSQRQLLQGGSAK